MTWPGRKLTSKCIQGESSNQLSHVEAVNKVLLRHNAKKHAIYLLNPLIRLRWQTTNNQHYLKKLSKRANTKSGP